MVERIPEPSKYKFYVQVKAVFHKDGRLMPISFVWEDGREYNIDRIMDITQAASLKAGGNGMRYTCSVSGKQAYLFFEKDRWFMERRG